MQSVDAPRIHSSNFTSIQLFLSLEGTQGGRGITWKEQKDRELEENGFMSSPSRLPWTARTCPVKVRISSGNSGFLPHRGAEARGLAVERAVPAPSRQLKGRGIHAASDAVPADPGFPPTLWKRCFYCPILYRGEDDPYPVFNPEEPSAGPDKAGAGVASISIGGVWGGSCNSWFNH